VATHLRSLALLALVAAWAGACGGSGRSAPKPFVDPEGSMPRITSLDVNPRDGALLVATNTGLYRIPRASRRPQRMQPRLAAGSRAEIAPGMAFAFTGPDELVGSGHTSGLGAPPLVGLVRSGDAGRTWTAVSGEGEFDFHALQLSERWLVLSDALSGTLRTSDDGGRTFAELRPPEQVLDLAVDPEDLRRLVVTTRTRLFFSAGGGRRWRSSADVPLARVTWPAPRALFRADPPGDVLRSSDGGRTWRKVGRTGTDAQALAACGRGARASARPRALTGEGGSASTCARAGPAARG
jgi:hypothetical protein